MEIKNLELYLENRSIIEENEKLRHKALLLHQENDALLSQLLQQRSSSHPPNSALDKKQQGQGGTCTQGYLCYSIHLQSSRELIENDALCHVRSKDIHGFIEQEKKYYKILTKAMKQYFNN
ncbi:hypothetical protein RJ639_031701 [Escallonia herrerae]|uniref:Uncharacterized protein n=1 Tax=Escallonia herrerae TaxID=1293975 RepID=A0AA89BBU3_9ASTE|nr:hypothetical protein RJ639_031701 [Escallonia herrerae]